MLQRDIFPVLAALPRLHEGPRHFIEGVGWEEVA